MMMHLLSASPVERGEIPTPSTKTEGRTSNAERIFSSRNLSFDFTNYGPVGLAQDNPVGPFAGMARPPAHVLKDVIDRLGC